MVVKLHQVILPVPDFTRAVDFYRHLLNMGGQSVSSGRHNFDCDGLILTCVDPQIEGEEFAASAPYHLRFSVEDPEGMFERAKKADCTFKDEGIITTPWGDQSFTAQDPFGNWLDFASAASLQCSLKECSATGPYDHLRIGRKLALKGLNRTDGEQVFASIAKVFQDTLWVKLLETHPEAPFQEGDAVRIQYWDVESAFYSDTTVSEISSLDNAYLAIVVPEETSELQRRTSPRVQTRLPITLSVVDAPQVSPSISQSISSHALDLGVGGMRFETDLPLEKGNQVRLMFSLPGLEEIQVDMRIATSNPVERAGERVNSVGATFVALELEDQIKILQFLIASRNDSKATEGQQGSGVEAIMASSAEAGPEVVSNAQPVVQSNEVPFPPASTASEKSVPETGDMPQNHEGHVPQVTAETATHVQENSQNTGVTDSHPDNHSQVVASS